jgi:hypothetical protein
MVAAARSSSVLASAPDMMAPKAAEKALAITGYPGVVGGCDIPHADPVLHDAEGQDRRRAVQEATGPRQLPAVGQVPAGRLDDR